MRELPDQPNPNEFALARIYRERLTGLTGTTLTLEFRVVEGFELVFKNGVLLDPAAAYTVDANVVTLTAAAVAGDVFVISYPYRE